MSEELREVSHPMIDAFTEEYLKIFAGPDGAGSAPHYYKVSTSGADGKPTWAVCQIALQEGHPKDGVNGIGVQSLLLVVLDFLQKANAGEFRCRETAVTITKIEEALQWNKQRELDRKQRGVLQTYNK